MCVFFLHPLNSCIIVKHVQFLLWYTNIYRFRTVLKTRTFSVLFFKHTLFLVLILLLQSYQPYLVQAVCLVAMVQIQCMFQLTLGFFVLVLYLFLLFIHL